MSFTIDQQNPQTSITQAAHRYFDLLAREFPTLCLQDEFIFFPRVAEARHEFHLAAHLKEMAIGDAVAEVHRLLTSLEDIAVPAADLETATDLVILQQSMRSFLREMGEWRVWAKDPVFYLKAASLTLVPVLACSALIPWQEEERLEYLLARIAEVFAWGSRQVQELSQPLQQLAGEAFDDTARFLSGEVTAFFQEHFPASAWWLRRLAGLMKELARFRDRVATRPLILEFRLGHEGLTRRLRESWGVEENLATIAAVLHQEEAEVTAALEHLRTGINSSHTWQELLDEYLPPPEAPGEPLELYRQEAARLQQFWEHNPILPPAAGELEVAPTPVYLRAVRAAASYTAPWIYQEGLPGIFYISPAVHDPAHRWRQHRFLSAHETYPGHHYLDLQRLRLSSPVRRQYESPLYYEGWACYAETLLPETGYLTDPRDLLVGYHRRLWRAIRGQVDLDLQTGRLDLDGAVKRLSGVGYPFPARQALRWALNPGYQVCYGLGFREMLRLRQHFAPLLGLPAFHAVLLQGGQLPFGLLEKRLHQAVAAK